MASLVHDDLIDRAALRRGKATAWKTHGAVGARATGDYLFARAFAELAGRTTPRGFSSSPTRRLRSSAARRCSTRRHRPETTVDDYLRRCSLKTAGSSAPRACSAAAIRGWANSAMRSGSPSRSPTTSRLLRRSTIETGKVAGSDLREGTPTLPLRRSPPGRTTSSARRSPGSPLDGALVRVAATGALEGAREESPFPGTRPRRAPCSRRRLPTRDVDTHRRRATRLTLSSY